MAVPGWVKPTIDATAALLGTGLSIGGAAASTKKQMHYQSDLMNKQFSFLERMSNTAHQREVEDLKKAGLNPLLSVMGGNGAGTPSAGMGQINAPDYGSSISEGISTALQLNRQRADINLINQQAKTEEIKRRNFESDSALKDSERMINEIERQYRGTKLESEINNYVADAKNKLATARASLITASANQVIANANAMNADTNVKNYKVQKETADVTNDKQRRYNEWAKKHPVLASTDETIQRHIGTLLGGIGGTAAGYAAVKKANQGRNYIVDYYNK